jgi:hypothetical protein
LTSGDFKDFFVEYFTGTEGILKVLQAKYPFSAASEATSPEDANNKKDKGGKGKGKGKGKQQAAPASAAATTEPQKDVAAETHEKVKSQIASLNWEDLFLSRGMPTYPQPDFSNSLSASALSLAKDIIAFAGKQSKENKAKVASVNITVCSQLFYDCYDWWMSQTSILLSCRDGLQCR